MLTFASPSFSEPIVNSMRNARGDRVHLRGVGGGGAGIIIIVIEVMPRMAGRKFVTRPGPSDDGRDCSQGDSGCL